MPAFLIPIIEFLVSMAGWEAGRLAVKGVGRKLLGTAAKDIAEGAGKRLAANVVGRGIDRGITGAVSKAGWLKHVLPESSLKIPTAIIGGAGGMAGLIAGMKGAEMAGEWGHSLLAGGETLDSDNLPALEQIRRQASMRDALCASTGLCAADVDALLSGGVR